MVFKLFLVNDWCNGSYDDQDFVKIQARNLTIKIRLLHILFWKGLAKILMLIALNEVLKKSPFVQYAKSHSLWGKKINTNL